MLTVGAALLAWALGLLSPATARAQRPPVEIGLGLSAFSGRGLSGAGCEIRLGTIVHGFASWNRIRIHGLVERADGTGPPLSCRQARQFHCLGRSDEVSQAGLLGELVVPLSERRPVDVYWLPVGLGLFHGSVRSEEAEGPVGQCIAGGQIVACSSNPPFTQFVKTTAGPGLELGTGFGMSIGLGSRRLSLEGRLLRSRSGNLPHHRATFVAGLAL